MQITRPAKQIAVLRYRCWLLPMVLGIGSLISLGRLAYLLISLRSAAPAAGELVGAGVAALLFAVGTIVFYENNLFVFDLANKLLIWKKRRIFRQGAGVVPFDQITSVIVDSMATERPSHRVVIVCAQERIPISNSYDAGNLEAKEKLAAEMQSLVGAKGSVANNSLRELVLSGKRIEATRYARDHLGISLSDAHAVVELMEKLNSAPHA